MQVRRGGIYIRRVTATCVAALAVGALYLWIARTANEPFHWRHDLGGYYNYLARGLARGQLRLAIEPPPALLALPNPWDPKVDDSLKMSDVALFNRRYYLYHGVTPAVLLFTPWRLITGHDVPENFALFLLCFAGFLFSAGALWILLRMANATPSPWLWAVMLIALGTCQCVPYLLNRVWVYEVAIGGAYFCMSAATFFLARAAALSYDARWLAASGLFFGLTVGCRPHLGLAGVIALAAVAFSQRRFTRIAAFLLPFLLAGLAIAAYNYARFGNPLEFGVKYLLTGENQQRIKTSAEFVLPGLYYMLFCAPRFTPVFPWVVPAFRNPFDSLHHSFPKEYFIEPTVGVLYLAPFLIGILALRKTMARATFVLLLVLLASSASVLLFISSTGFTTQRYEVDFLAPAVLVSVAIIAIVIARSSGWRRHALITAFTILLSFGVMVNLALGVAGPYDGLFKQRPRTYMRLAAWFTPSENYRPLLNPRIDVEFTAEFPPQSNGLKQPLLTIGDRTYRHFLYAQQADSRLHLVSQGETSTVKQEIDKPDGPVRFHVEYAPESGNLSVAVNGRGWLVHKIDNLLTAPWQVSVGENRIDPGVTGRRFPGRIRDVTKSVRSGPSTPSGRESRGLQ
jgi:hypothetical protein